jgi:hypothetical protein
MCTYLYKRWHENVPAYLYKKQVVNKIVPNFMTFVPIFIKIYHKNTPIFL